MNKLGEAIIFILLMIGMFYISYFMLAYSPHGIKIVTSDEGVPVTQMDVSSGFADNSFEYYRERRILNNAPKGMLVEIITGQGGYSTSAIPLLIAMSNTKANTTTVIWAPAWAASYGGVTTMYGRRIKLKNTDRLMFHGVYYESLRKVAVKQTDRVYGPFKELFTPHQWAQLYDNSHPWIVLTGKQVCAKLKYRLIESNSSGCVIRGFRL